MQRPRKQVCQFCEKKFKRVKNHYKFCKARNVVQAEPVNFVTMSPHARLIKAVNEYWESLYDHQKIHAIAFALHPGRPE